MIKHHGERLPEQPANGEKAENGPVEEGGKTVREYACAFISQIEEGIGGVGSRTPDIPLVDKVGGHLLLKVCSWPGWTHWL